MFTARCGKSIVNGKGTYDFMRLHMTAIMFVTCHHLCYDLFGHHITGLANKIVYWPSDELSTLWAQLNVLTRMIMKIFYKIYGIITNGKRYVLNHSHLTYFLLTEFSLISILVMQRMKICSECWWQWLKYFRAYNLMHIGRLWPCSKQFGFVYVLYVYKN